MLQQYLACSSQYAPVQQAFSEVMKAEEMHRQALAEVWQTAVPLTGLLVSKVMDSNAFMKLSIYDATALEERLVEQGCQSWSRDKMEAFTKQATNESLETGLLGQTAQQLGFLFQELHVVKERLAEIPEEWEAVDQSILRVNQGFEEILKLRPSLVRKLMQRCSLKLKIEAITNSTRPELRPEGMLANET
ncbi:unnamed protein product [Durusdinium trenchii]|uniref:Uncharacterized protein n=2 Tax=Durusdinium trenchii TaxID=1381693 RepID=A0ABP0HF11_9DINO